ncbi:unnamed protein product [Rhodiola kirilowii]
MNQAELDGMVMSTLATFDNPIIDEYDRDEMEMLEEFEVVDGNNVPEPKNLWDYPCFDDVSGWMENDTSAGHRRNNSSSDNNLICEGKTFDSKEDAIYAAQRFSVLTQVEFSTYKSDHHRIILICRDGANSCPWRILIAKKKGSSVWEVTTSRGDHTCTSDIIPKDNMHLTKDFIALEIKRVMTEQVRYTARQIMGLVSDKFGYQIKYLKAWQAKEAAMKMLFGDWKKSFSDLPAYMQALVDSNPGTIVLWSKSEGENNVMTIDRVFWAFAPAISAFRHCRPVICIDGTHMYGRYNGKLLVAMGLDANNQLVPLAFALVESENNESWRWFMRCIRIGVTQRDGLCVISDRHNGILHAMNEPEWTEPRAYHRFCSRHVASNFNTKVKNVTLKKTFSTATHQNQLKKFVRHYGELKDELKNNTSALSWLESIRKEKWCLAYDEGGRRWGSLTTNASESFNHALRAARDLPVCALVHFTFKQSNAYFCARREQYRNTTSLFMPEIDGVLNKYRDRAAFHKVEMYDREHGEYQVTTGRHHHTHNVNLSARKCSCGKWQAFHYPCSHVLAVCKMENLSHLQFVASEYTVAAYNATWSYKFYPVPDKDCWQPYEGPAHIPNSAYRRMKRGRNPTKRRRNEMDQGSQGQTSSQRVQKCSKCRGMGHNKKTCTFII